MGQISLVAVLLLIPRFFLLCGVELTIYVVCLVMPRPRWVLTSLARALLWCVGVNPIVFVQKNEPSSLGTEPAIVVCNHPSVMDGFVLSYALGAPSFLAKSSMKGLPIFGRILTSLGVVFVDRSSAKSRSEAVLALSSRAWPQSSPSSLRPASDLLPPIVVFPEGTTTGNSTGQLRPFRAGAFRPGAPVRPIRIDYGADAWWVNGGRTPRSTGEAPSDLEVIMRLVVSAPWHTATVRVFPTYFPKDAERQDPALYAENVRLLIQSKATSA
jgi:lysophosphatidylcholine acyltransferase/lyso-PAF acetyltransferase